MKTIALLASSLVALISASGCSSGPNGTGSGGAGGSAASAGVAGATGGAQGGGDQGGAGGSDITGGAGGTGTGAGGSKCDAGSLDKEGCGCTSGEAPHACYVGPAEHAGNGQCTMGSQTCITQGQGEFLNSAWGPCTGSGLPGPEVCNDGIDNDCDGVVNNGCQCKDGDMQSCDTGMGPGTQTCMDGKWGDCNCVDGTQQGCVTPAGGSGTQTCINGQWSQCGGIKPKAGDPCTPGDVQPDNDHMCPSGSPTSVLECENDGVYHCFWADDCTPAACKQCLETNCAAQMVNADPQCQTQLTAAVTWLEKCGPDRSGYFSNLSNGCGSPNAQDLNSCKFSHCIMNGTCSFW